MDDLINVEIVKRLIICSRYLRHYRHKNMAQDRTIEMIGRNGGEMSQKEIQTTLGIKAGSVSELISKLESRSLIVKKKSTTDKRAYNILLTEAGWKNYQEIIDTVDVYQGLFSSLNDDECIVLNILLDRLSNDWMERAPELISNQQHGSVIFKDDEGNYDVDLSKDSE